MLCCSILCCIVVYYTVISCITSHDVVLYCICMLHYDVAINPDKISGKFQMLVALNDSLKLQDIFWGTVSLGICQHDMASRPCNAPA